MFINSYIFFNQYQKQLLINHIFIYVDSWQRQGTELPLQWPTEIVSNPVDDSLTIMDEGYLLVLSKEGVVYPLPINNCDNQEDTDRLVYNFDFIFNYYIYNFFWYDMYFHLYTSKLIFSQMLRYIRLFSKSYFLLLDGRPLHCCCKAH